MLLELDMLPGPLLWTLSMILLSGCVAAESLYKLLGGKFMLGLARQAARARLITLVSRDASEGDIKKAYRVSRRSSAITGSLLK